MFETITIVSIKNRLETPTTGGWADVVLKFHFTNDPRKHVCEVQLAHVDMMRVRKRMNAHRAYSEYRCAGELLEATGQQSALEAIKSEAAAISSAAAARSASTSPDRFVPMGSITHFSAITGRNGGGVGITAMDNSFLHSDVGGGGLNEFDARLTSSSDGVMVNVDDLNATIGRLANENAELWLAMSRSQADQAVLRDGFDSLKAEMAALTTSTVEILRTASQSTAHLNKP